MRFNLSFPKNKSFDVVGMGLNSVDFLCVVPEFPTLNSKMKIRRFSRQGGGQVATAMAALSRWGVKTKYIGKIGSDEWGRFSLESLREEGIDVSSITMEPHASNQYAFIIVDGVSGERTILWNRDEGLMYREGELSRRDVCSGKLLHLDGHDIRAALQCAKWAREEGIPTVIDIDKVEPLTPELIRGIDFVITSSRFPALFTGIADRERALIELQRHTRGFVCATLGHEGAVALVEGRILHVNGFPVKAVDTTGAGDVFHAGFIFGLMQNWEVDEILRFSNAVASLKCLDLGGRKGIPTLETARTLLSKTPESIS
jgi:sugar/nucleoside kinase (ribokinase family)